MRYDECRFEKEDHEITDDEKVENLHHTHIFHHCTISEEEGNCPFPTRHCHFKEQNDDPTIGPGSEIQFNDGSILQDAVKELNGLFED